MPNYEIRELQNQLKVYADGEYVAAVQEGKFRPYVYPFFTPAGHNVLQIAPADHAASIKDYHTDGEQIYYNRDGASDPSDLKIFLNQCCAVLLTIKSEICY